MKWSMNRNEEFLENIWSVTHHQDIVLSLQSERRACEVEGDGRELVNGAAVQPVLWCGCHAVWKLVMNRQSSENYAHGSKG